MFVSLLRILKKQSVHLLTHNVSIGKNVTVDFGTKIYNNSNKITIGDNVYLRSIKKGYQAGMPFPTTLLIDVAGASIEIGDQSRINGVYIHAQKKIVIGKMCVIASGVNIIDSNGHILYSADRTKKERDLPEEIIIGNNVWVGVNSIILKGTKIGDNSVVGAGSVVKGTYPENSLIVGNPATVVKILDIR